MISPQQTVPEQETENARAIPFVITLLALGAFLMITTEFVVAGLLPEMAHDFKVSVAKAGLLITAFAFGMILGAPVMALATLHLPRRLILVAALAVFSAGHALAALSSSFALLLGARVLTAVVTGAYWAVAGVVAIKAAGPSSASRAIAVMLSGLSAAIVVGVPLGSWAGQHLGWRGTFWALAALAAAAAMLIARFVPDQHDDDVPSVRRELGALRNSRLWRVFAVTALVGGGDMATFGYITPLLTERASLSPGQVPLVLAGFGLGALLGTRTSGRFADRKPLTTLLVASAGSTLVLALLIAVSQQQAGTVVAVALLGAVAMAVSPVAGGLAYRFANDTPTLSSAMIVSAFNTGIAVGTGLAGAALSTSLHEVGPATVGLTMTALGLLPLLALAGTTRALSRADADDSRPHLPSRDQGVAVAACAC